MISKSLTYETNVKGVKSYGKEQQHMENSNGKPNGRFFGGLLRDHRDKSHNGKMKKIVKKNFDKENGNEYKA